MTVDQAIRINLIARGLNEYQAEELFQRLIVDPGAAVMANRWFESANKYPALFRDLSATINRVVLAWLDEPDPRGKIDRSLFECAP
jgi:hypothetical protein